MSISKMQITSSENLTNKLKNKKVGIKKGHLPSKICMVCNRPFSWRKKWERVWEEVKYCSKGCRSKKNYAIPVEDFIEKKCKE